MGSERWLFELQKVGNKRELQRQIAGMNQGDLGSFQHIMEMAHDALKKSTSNLKHIIVFSDGDPGAPSPALMQAIVGDRITVSSVLISGHSPIDTMTWMADVGKGRFYNVQSPNELPQIFLKETAVILKSAIYEEPFKPQLRSSTEVIRGIGADEYPSLLGYVATTVPKPRAETPLWTDKGGPAAGATGSMVSVAPWRLPQTQIALGQDLAELGEIQAVLVADCPVEFAPPGKCGLYTGSHGRERPGPHQR